ncbi:conserved hypothetical protein [Formosa agariphila KMM 3901]|uniref:Uncharacterized protein n=1 Tax=Formosa agariphila (strain DSM 15362 / KCTC 12365 / LMG 23005 / KMM 3901 / M-2Alg 35-1) TaxID=1347342 RepID=T2KJN2_FORAG|nr:hypothetical protein [Formosa agariphila]CDF79102.1 conserved hypothetical protein [Formosa agariphila KMM 3901]
MPKNKNYKKLALSILLDAVGYVSFIVPGIGEFSDIIWAPASAYIMTKLYKGQQGKVAAGISFLEEAMPGLDIIPTFTLMWFYTYVFSSSSSKEKEIESKKSLI